MFFRQAHPDHQPMQQYQLQAAGPQQAQPTSACPGNNLQGSHHAAGWSATSTSCVQHAPHRGLPPLGPGHHTTTGSGHPTAAQQHPAADGHPIHPVTQHHRPPQQQQHSVGVKAASRSSEPAGLYSAFKASLMQHDQQPWGRQPQATGSHPSTSSHSRMAVDQQQDQGHSLWQYQQQQMHQQQQQQQQQCQRDHHHVYQGYKDPEQQRATCDTLGCPPARSEELECDEMICNIAFPAPYIASHGVPDPSTATAAAAQGGGGGGAGWAAACGQEVDTSLYRTSTGKSSVESDSTAYHGHHQRGRSAHTQCSLLRRCNTNSMTRSSSSKSSSGSGRDAEEEDDCMQVDDRLAPGVSSAGRRCCIAVMSVYTDINSPETLVMANTLMARIKLPGGVSFVPVEPDFFLWRAATAWSFPAYATVLASSYFQRLLVALPHLAQAAASVPSLSGYCRGASSPSPSTSSSSEGKHVEATMRSIQVSCLYVALKVADQVHALGLLRFMLTAIGGNVHPVPLGDAELVEARVLDGLGWRLGPFYAEDDLEELGFDGDVWGVLE